MTEPLFPSHSDLIKQQHEHREELRRDIETYVEPEIEAAHNADKSSIELGQSILRTATLLNGGALIAIPAVVTLFGIDAKSIMRNLLWAGGCFALGLIFSWLSGCWGFFTLAHRADRDYARGEATRRGLYHGYYPSNDEAEKPNQLAAINELQLQTSSRHRTFVIFRMMAIGFTFLSLAAFVAGNVIGGLSVLHAPTKPAPVVQSSPAPTKP
jgi:hypothetical protein